MTSSNGNIFRVTGHLCGEFTDPRWIPRTKASDAELWCFFLICARINDWVNNGEAGDLRGNWAHYDVIVMIIAYKTLELSVNLLVWYLFEYIHGCLNLHHYLLTIRMIYHCLLYHVYQKVCTVVYLVTNYRARCDITHIYSVVFDIFPSHTQISLLSIPDKLQLLTQSDEIESRKMAGTPWYIGCIWG